MEIKISNIEEDPSFVQWRTDTPYKIFKKKKEYKGAQ
jgi:hypothetical protein